MPSGSGTGTGSENLIALLPEVADTGEIFNLHEDGSVQMGQLHRFLKIMGPTLDEMKGLVDAMPTMIDVDITDSDFLPHMAELVGVEFNREIPIPQQREEIKGAIQWYKRKGLLVGSRIHGYRITRLQTDIVEFWRNIKTSNRTYSYSTENTGPSAMNYGLPGDPSAFAYDFEVINEMVKGNEFASSEMVGFEAWRVLDKREATSWKSSTSAPAFWGYEFDNPTIPLRFKMHTKWGVREFRLQWSDGGVAWEDAGDYIYGDVLPFTEFVGSADGGAQSLVIRKVPAAPSPAPEVYEVTGSGPVSTHLTVAAEEGSTQISVAAAGGLSRHDWIEISDVSGNIGYHQIDDIEGNIITLTTGIFEKDGFPVLSDVKDVTVTLKTVTTDYTINPWSGELDLIAGKFTNGSNVFVSYTALTDKSTVGVWQEYEVDTENLDPHKYWRFLIDSTWTGDPQIDSLELYGDQFYGTFYRCERLGYFLTLGNARPGCGGQIICNQPLLQETVEKLCRTMKEAVPATCEPVIVGIDCRYPERFNVETLARDAYKDGVHTRNREHFSTMDDMWSDVTIDRSLWSTWPGHPPEWGPPPYEDRGSPPLTTVDGYYFISLTFPP